MPQVINTNISSLNAQRALNSTQGAAQTAMERLSSGTRINAAHDDSAGLAIAESMTSQINGLNQAVRNTNDGISYVQTAEGALDEVSNMLQRIRELKVQDSNGTNNSTQSGYIDKEFAALVTEIENVIVNTKFNGASVLSGAHVANATGGGADDLNAETVAVKLQTGWESGDTITIAAFNLVDNATGATEATAQTNLGKVLYSAKSDSGFISAGTYGTKNDSFDDGVTLTEIDDALDEINSQRAQFGAYQNRLESNSANMQNVSENISASRSRIMDTDFAAESAELARTNVLQQAGMAMLSQANQSGQAVLSLLR